MRTSAEASHLGAIPTIAPYLIPRYTAAFTKGFPDDSLSLAELRGESLVMLTDGHCFRDLGLAICRSAHVNPNIAFESGQSSSFLGMVAVGIGLSLVPEMAIDPHADCRYLAFGKVVPSEPSC